MAARLPAGHDGGTGRREGADEPARRCGVRDQVRVRARGRVPGRDAGRRRLTFAAHRSSMVAAYAAFMRMRPVLDWPPGGDVLAPTGELDDVYGILAAGRVAVLSGAGLSTASGIPDYRGATRSLRRQRPMTYEDFLH